MLIHGINVRKQICNLQQTNNYNIIYSLHASHVLIFLCIFLCTIWKVKGPLIHVTKMRCGEDSPKMRCLNQSLYVAFIERFFFCC